MKLVIIGASGSGKTTAVRRLLKYCSEPIYGFYTQKLPSPDEAPVYLHGFTHPLRFSRENLIGTCRERRPVSYPEVFDTVGTALLREIPAGALAVLDEIGVMESKALLFQQELFRLLDGDYRLLLTVRDLSTPLLDKIRAHPLVTCLPAQRANEESTAAALAAELFLQPSR